MEELSLIDECSESYKVSSSVGIHFPLPAHENTAICRDEFLRSVLPELSEKLDFRASVYSYSADVKSKGVKIIDIQPKEKEENAEGLGVLELIRKNKLRMTQSSIMNTFRLSLTREEKLFIYHKFLQTFQTAALEFLSVRMRKQIDTILKVWPGDLTEVPHKLFNWSVEHFMRRIQVNQLYLEVMIKERSSHELNCAKFCTDITEIIRLLNSIRENYSGHNDVCKHSIQLLKDSNYEVTSNWSEELERLRRIYNDLDYRCRQSMDRGDTKWQLSNLTASMYDDVATMPIIMRYRINWMNSTEEQIIRYLDNKDNALQNEKDALTDGMNQEANGFKLDEYVYQYQIEKYRLAITHWEAKLEIDLEEAELQCNITRNILNKVKEDSKIYNERVQMFREKIDSVTELLAQEELKKLVATTLTEDQTSVTSKRRKKKINKKKF